MESIDDAFGRDVADQAEQLLYNYVMATMCNYRRRITARVAEWPCKLLGLAKSESHVECPTRLSIATELLAYEKCLHHVHVAARKTVLCFGPELHDIVARSGMCSSVLYAPFKLLRRHWRCDSQELEGVIWE